MRPFHCAVHVVRGIRRRDVTDSDNTPLAALDPHRPDQPLAHAIRQATSGRPRPCRRLRYPMAERILPRVEMQRVARPPTTIRSGRHRLQTPAREAFHPGLSARNSGPHDQRHRPRELEDPTPNRLGGGLCSVEHRPLGGGRSSPWLEFLNLRLRNRRRTSIFRRQVRDLHRRPLQDHRLDKVHVLGQAQRRGARHRVMARVAASGRGHG